MNEAVQAVLRDVAADPVFAAGAAVAVLSALAMATRRNPVYSALWLMVCFLAVAVIFLKLHAPFLASIHVLVYTGAILVLFLFVIMLLNLQPHELGGEPSRRVKAAVAVLGAAMAGALGLAVLKSGDGAAPFDQVRTTLTAGTLDPVQPSQWGGVEHVGHDLFARFVVPFEIVSVLIVVAIAGAVVLAKRKL